MSLALLFWIVFLIAILVYGAFNWPLNRSTGSGLIVFLLLFILGWAVFGFVIRDDGGRRQGVTVIRE